MRKLLFAFVLPLLLLLSQQGRIVHELGHQTEQLARLAASAAPSQAPDPEHSSQHKACDACLAFAHLAAAARSEPLALPLHNLRAAFAATSRHAVLAARALTARSRGPPLFP